MPENTPPVVPPAAPAPVTPAPKAPTAPAHAASAPNSAGTANDANTGAGAQPTDGKRSDLNFDDLVKADLAFKRKSKEEAVKLEQERQSLAAKAEKYKVIPEDVLDLLSRGELVDAIKKLEGGKMTPDMVLALADHVGDRQTSAEKEAAVPVEEKIKAALEADRKAREKEEADAKTAKETAAAAEWQEQMGGYLNSTVGFLKNPALWANPEEFHLCAKWGHRLPLERIEREVQRRLSTGESVEIRDVLMVYEAEFESDINATKYGKQPASVTERTFEDHEREYFASRAPKVEAKPVVAPVEEVKPFVAPADKPFDDSARDYLIKLHNDRRNRARF